MIELIKKYKFILVLILILFINFAILFMKEHQKEEALLILDERSYTEQEVTIEAVQPVVQVTSSIVPIYICGQVRIPGVYSLVDSAIVKDVLDAAGGFLEDANPNVVNLARQIVPNEQIYIPKWDEEIKNEMSLYSSASTEEPVININTATLEQLMTLPGIGEVKAKKIIQYRETTGHFKSTEAIKNVTGIGEKTYVSIQQMITTE